MGFFTIIKNRFRSKLDDAHRRVGRKSSKLERNPKIKSNIDDRVPIPVMLGTARHPSVRPPGLGSGCLFPPQKGRQRGVRHYLGAGRRPGRGSERGAGGAGGAGPGHSLDFPRGVARSAGSPHSGSMSRWSMGYQWTAPDAISGSRTWSFLTLATTARAGSAGEPGQQPGIPLGPGRVPPVGGGRIFRPRCSGC